MTNLYQKISSAIGELPVARQPAALYWRIGLLVNKEEQLCKWDKAQLRSALNKVAALLADDGLPDFKATRLLEMKKFQAAFPDASMLRPTLSWSHYQLLAQAGPATRRRYYAEAAAKNHWSAQQLKRELATDTFGRLAAVQQQGGVAPPGPNDPVQVLKEPYIFEFLGLDAAARPFQEKDLLAAMLANMTAVLQELGEGFAFVAHQKLVVTPSGKQFFIDLVFYHYLLKCFVLVDLKTAELTHADIGQMDMYIRLFEDFWRLPADAPTFGMILCPAKDPALMDYSMLSDHNRLFALTFKLGPDAAPNISAQ